MPSKRDDVLGSGLPLWALGAVFLLSFAVFLFYGGPLWLASREATHTMRIFVSYLVLVPSVLVALLVLKRLTPARAITALFLLASVKLVVTASLYTFAAPGHANTYHPRDPTLPEARSARPRRTRPTRTEGEEIALVIRDGAYEQAEYHARVGDRIVVQNADASLHTVHVHRGGESLANTPLPASEAPHRLQLPGAGTYELRCDIDPRVTTRLIVGPEAPRD